MRARSSYSSRLHDARFERLVLTQCRRSVAMQITVPFFINGGKQLEPFLYGFRRKGTDFRQGFQLFQQFA